MLAQGRGRTKTSVGGNVLDGKPSGFEQFLSPGQTLLGEPTAETQTHLLLEAAREGATAHGGTRRNRIEIVRRGQIGEDRLHGAGEAIGSIGGEQRAFDELGLAALTVWRGDNLPSEALRALCAKLPPYDVEAAIQSGRDASGGHHVAGIDIENIRTEPDSGVEGSQPVG